MIEEPKDVFSIIGIVAILVIAMIIFFFVKLGLRLLDDSPDNVSIDEIGQ